MAGIARNGSDSAAPMVAMCDVVGLRVVDRRRAEERTRLEVDARSVTFTRAAALSMLGGLSPTANVPSTWGFTFLNQLSSIESRLALLCRRSLSVCRILSAVLCYSLLSPAWRRYVSVLRPFCLALGSRALPLSVRPTCCHCATLPILCSVLDDCCDSLTLHSACLPTMVDLEKTTPHKKTRVVSVVAATAIALACGTNVCPDPDITEHILTPRSMRTQPGHRSSQTSSNSPPLKAMSSYAHLHLLPRAPPSHRY